MLKKIISNTRINIKYYFSNRIFISVGVILLFMIGLAISQTLSSVTDNRKFTIIMNLFRTISSYIQFFVSIIAIFSFSHFINNRNVKMILTRPCRPEQWILSHFTAAFFLAFCLYVLNTVFAYTMLFFLGIQFQTDILHLAFYLFLNSMISFSYVLFWTILWFNPITGYISSMVISNWAVSTALTTIGKELLQGPSTLYAILNKVFTVFYYILPVSVFPEETTDIMRVVYCICVCGSLYCMAAWTFNKKILRNQLL